MACLNIAYPKGVPVRALKRIIAFIYLACAACAIGAVVGMLFTPYSPYITLALRHDNDVRLAMAVGLSVLSLGVLISWARMTFTRKPVSCVHPAGDKRIEVSLAAIESCARTAATEAADVMVENVEGKIAGKAGAEVKLELDIIAFTEQGLAELGSKIESHVVSACEAFLGTDGVSCRVRFLPARTTSQTKEVTDER